MGGGGGDRILSEPQHSPFHDLGRRLPIAARVSLRVRRRMYERFLAIMRPSEHTSILDLGVTNEADSPEANAFERWYPHKHRLVCAGVEDASHLERRYPGLRFTTVVPHQPLPFRDQQFDIVFSNAVVEHAGSRAEQRAFIAEAVRVARQFFITTPNRWFPIEMHTALPLLHYLPIRIHRRVLSSVGHAYWAAEDHLHLLDASSLRALFAPPHDVQIARVRLGGLVSNLIAHNAKPPALRVASGKDDTARCGDALSCARAGDIGST
jgi:SAM-dependent methyltransferase